MSPALLRVYHALPPFARGWVASAKGLRLRQWRYGPETQALVAAARARETWPAGQWRQWQEDHVRELLAHAAQAVPFYRAQRVAGTAERLNLPAWPVLTKAQLRAQPRGFRAEGSATTRMCVEQTSGTTGTPLTLWESREASRAWYALMEARWRGWYGLSRRDRWGILGGQLVTPATQKSPPFWVWNAPLHQLYLSSYHLSPETCADYLQALRDHQLTYLWGYASSLYSLALLTEEQHLPAPHLKEIISNAEPLYAHQRRQIARVFGCPVRDTYGTSEKVCAASECEAGRLHLWPEVAVYEVLRDETDEPAPWGQVGRLVCTGLLNPHMPLIRYEVGDRVAIAPPTERCACGRTLPLLLSVEGRSDDVILTADGRRIGRLDPVFKADLPIHEGQIIQESLQLLRVLVVPGQGFSPAHEQALRQALRQRVGEVEVRLERVAAIPRSANGKFRAVISKIKPAPPGIPGGAQEVACGR